MHINTIPMVGVYIYRGTEQIHLGHSEMDDHKALPASETPLLMYPSPTLHKFKEANPDDQHCYTSHQQQQSLYQQWRPTLSEVVQEIKQLYTTAIPMIITGLLIYGKSMISTLFMGRLGKEALASGSLSVGIANITGYSIISGLALGMEAISSQAFGAKQWAIMTQTLHQTTAILLLVSIPISLLWLNINPILLLCGQDPTISAIASTYLAFSVPDLFFQSFFSPLKIYLRTQNITLPLMLSAAFSLAIHAPINYFLVYYLHLGIRGIAMASAIATLNLLISLFLYIQFSGISVTKSWEMSSVTCFNDWKTLLSLAIPSCVSVCLEWWWYELMIVLAGLLPNALEAVAAMGILLQATSLIYIFPSALSLGVSTRVGNELGANQPGKAKTSSIIALLCAILNGFIAMLFIMTMKNGWGGVFTVDSGVLAATAAVMPVAALCEVGNCLQTAGCGVLRGSARPASAANINLGSFYGVGLPVAVVMGLVMDMGLFGLWLGLLAAQVVCAVSIVFLLRKTDWVHEANRGRELIGIDEEKQ